MATAQAAPYLIEEHQYVCMRSDSSGDWFVAAQGGFTPIIGKAKLFSPTAAYNFIQQHPGCCSIDVAVFKPVGPRLEAGYLLLELLIITAILVIMAALAVPNLYRIKMYQQETDAIGRVAQVAHVQAAVTSCQTMPGCTVAPNALALIPAPNSVQAGSGYTFLMASDGVTFTATPTNPKAGQSIVSVGPSGLVMCGGSPCTR